MLCTLPASCCSLFHGQSTLFLFYKDLFYKSVEAEICPQISEKPNCTCSYKKRVYVCISLPSNWAVFNKLELCSINVTSFHGGGSDVRNFRKNGSNLHHLQGRWARSARTQSSNRVGLVLVVVTLISMTTWEASLLSVSGFLRNCKICRHFIVISSQRCDI